MSIRGVFIAASAAIVCGVGAAGAADLGSINYGSMKDNSYVPSIATQPSWYIRLDGSYAAHDRPDLTENDVDTLTETDYGNAWSFGGGIGRYFTDSIRGDLTYEHRFEADVTGSNMHPNANLIGVRRFGIESDLFLANLYYDFDMRGRFTPYLGVGLGVVRHKTKVGTVESCGCTTGEIASGEKWSVAGALMAGISMQLRDRLHADVGYRFLYLGDAETGAITEVSGPTPVEIADDPKVHEIHAHEVRFGLRYDIR